MNLYSETNIKTPTTIYTFIILNNDFIDRQIYFIDPKLGNFDVALALYTETIPHNEIRGTI